MFFIQAVTEQIHGKTLCHAVTCVPSSTMEMNDQLAGHTQHRLGASEPISLDGDQVV